MEPGPWLDATQFMLYGVGLNVFVYCLGFLGGQFMQWLGEVAKA